MDKGGTIAQASDMLLKDFPYSPNLSDSAECVILCTSWLQSPGKVSRQMWGHLSEQGSVMRGLTILHKSFIISLY